MIGKVVDITSEGAGVIRAEKVVFVYGALTGDVVEYEVVQDKKKFQIGRLLEIKEYSDKRRFKENPLGDAYPLYPLTEKAEMEIKIGHLEQNLKKIAGLDFSEYDKNEAKTQLKDEELSAKKGQEDRPEFFVHLSDSYLVNKLRLHVDSKHKKIGLYRHKSHEIYEPDYKMLITEEGAELVEGLKSALFRGDLKAASYIVIRRDTSNRFYLATDGALCNALLHADNLDKNKETIKNQKNIESKEAIQNDEIRQNEHKDSMKVFKIKGCDVPLYGVQDKNGMRGQSPIMRIGGIDYCVDIDGFFQNSVSGAEAALDIIGDKKRGSVLDLYSGVGFLSLFVGKNAESVHGVEANERAVEHAKYNVKKNNECNFTFTSMDTAKYMKRFLNGSFNKNSLDFSNQKKQNTNWNVSDEIKEPANYDTIIVDPPRSGLVKDVVDGILQVKPVELIYMSCNHATMCRDLKSLLPYYKINEIHLIDMFKGAVDSEVIVKLESKSIRSH